MPSVFGSVAPLRTGSMSTPTRSVTMDSPNARRGSVTLEALTRGLRKKSEIEIVLDGKTEFIRTYSTNDKIQGHVGLKFDKDVLIGDLHIVFEGQSETYVEKMAAATPTTGRTTGKHTFVRVHQPITRESLPENMLAKAKTAYTIPFTFTVPERLLSYVCNHKVDNDEVRGAHLCLPPSIGDPMVTGEGNTLMDDLAPDMAKIGYAIKAKIGKVCPATGKLIDIEEKVARIRIAPAREEAPPLSIYEENVAYIMRKEKNVRKGVFKIGKKQGRLAAEVAQPNSLRLPSTTSPPKGPVTTMASVTLRFDPASEQEQPPQMANLSAKLIAYTFYGAAGCPVIPEPSKYDSWSTIYGMYPINIVLSCRNIGSVSWKTHDSGNRKGSTAAASDHAEITRRNSDFSSESSISSGSSVAIPKASEAYNPSLPFYTAKVLVPVSLPYNSEGEGEARRASTASGVSAPLHKVGSSKKTIFTPTFHSCIVSRAYALELDLSFHPVNSSGNTTSALNASSLTLRTPIQISQEGSTTPFPDTEEPDYDLSVVEGTDEYDEALARHLDQEWNSANPFSGTTNPQGPTPEAIPAYEEVQTTFPRRGSALPRHASIAVPPSATQQEREDPPEYYSPFRTPSARMTAAMAEARR